MSEDVLIRTGLGDIVPPEPLAELLSVGPRVYHALVFQGHDPEVTEWQDVEIIGFDSRYPICLMLTANPRSTTAIGRFAALSYDQLHSDESELWQKHLRETK